MFYCRCARISSEEEVQVRAARKTNGRRHHSTRWARTYLWTVTGSHAIELLTARFQVLRFRLYWIENKSESDIASRWVHSETNLMFTLSSEKWPKEKFAFVFACTQCKWTLRIYVYLYWTFIITARQQSLGQGNIFRSVCQEFCPQGGCMVAGGACVVARGMCGCWGAWMVAGGCAWLQEGMRGCGGHAWLPGACLVAGGACMVAGWHVWLQGGMCGWGVCMVARVGYDEIRSMILLECILVL